MAIHYFSEASDDVIVSILKILYPTRYAIEKLGLKDGRKIWSGSFFPTLVFQFAYGIPPVLTISQSNIRVKSVFSKAITTKVSRNRYYIDSYKVKAAIETLLALDILS